MAPLPRVTLVASVLALGACNRAPAEPEGRAASSAAPSPAVAPVVWDTPGTWAKLDAPGSGPKKATYRVEVAGSEDSEASVFFFGTGAKGDPATVFKEWFEQFDAGATATMDKLRTQGLEIDTMEVAGTYKIALTPTPRGKKQPGVQMVKNKWRLYGAVVKTPDRGNWFFKLTGPEDAVMASRSAFRAMVESAR